MSHLISISCSPCSTSSTETLLSAISHQLYCRYQDKLAYDMCFIASDVQLQQRTIQQAASSGNPHRIEEYLGFDPQADELLVAFDFIATDQLQEVLFGMRNGFLFVRLWTNWTVNVSFTFALEMISRH